MRSDQSNTDASKKEGHRGRLRQRFLNSGLEGFHDYEVIELLLTLATPRKDCKAVAKAALEQFVSFRGVMEATPEALSKIKGIGPRNILGIRLMKAVMEKYLKEKMIAKVPIVDAKSLHDYLKASLAGRRIECIMAVFLDAKNRVIDSKVLAEGTLTTSSIYPREVVRAALEHHAAAVILAHNHPSGDPNPSNSDMTITRRLLYACHVMDIVLHDHLVMGSETYFSFADEGYMDRLKREMEEVPQ